MCLQCKYSHYISCIVTVGGSGGHENLHTYGCDNTVVL
jgi:hypothetical protein